MTDAIAIDPAWTTPTWYIDSDATAVAEYVDRATAGIDRDDHTAVAVALFHAVRDGIRYDPYGVDYDPLACNGDDAMPGG